MFAPGPSLGPLFVLWLSSGVNRQCGDWWRFLRATQHRAGLDQDDGKRGTMEKQPAMGTSTVSPGLEPEPRNGPTKDVGDSEGNERRRGEGNLPPKEGEKKDIDGREEEGSSGVREGKKTRRDKGVEWSQKS